MHRISVVIPVYQGEHTLGPLVSDLAAFFSQSVTPSGEHFQVEEVILVHDGAIDRSHEVIQALATKYTAVKPVWLSRNFGQHPATLAGIASTVGTWVITMDEDGQNRAEDIASLLDMALSTGAQLVYGNPLNPPPHGLMRNMLSGLTKRIFTHILGNKHIGKFSSFRLIEGEVARSLAAYCGSGVFLDVALSWVVKEAAHCPVVSCAERAHRSGYTFGSLVGHFWRLLVTSGTRPLRFISFLGLLSLLLSIALTVYALWVKMTIQMPIAGWASTIIVSCFFFGATLLSLSIVAEYLAIALSIVMGKPPYLIVSHPTAGKRK
jgi:undecaprenyl-phosphate 4-deoxy-4-formamido-L-arabinose transferase